MSVARLCPAPYAESIRRQNLDSTETFRTIAFGFRRVKLPGRREPLSLVVIRGFGQEPTMLLTTLDVRGGRKNLWWVVEAYLTRWRMSTAADLMSRHPGLSVGQVAGQVGYRSEEAFCRAFRRETGVTPREYLARGDASALPS